MITNKKDLIHFLEILIHEINSDLRKDYYLKHKDEYLYRSFERWAYEELIREIEDSFDDTNIYQIVEGFCKKMNKYSLINKKTSYMFSAAYDAGMNIYDVVILIEDDPYYQNEYFYNRFKEVLE